MLEQMALIALKNGVCLSLHYEEFSRLVEVHTVGVDERERHVASVYQVSGASKSNEPIGWKLLLLQDATGATLTTDKSAAPRPGYQRDAKQFTRITGQL